jgi:hypothetical protein
MFPVGAQGTQSYTFYSHTTKRKKKYSISFKNKLPLIQIAILKYTHKAQAIKSNSGVRDRGKRERGDLGESRLRVLS